MKAFIPLVLYSTVQFLTIFFSGCFAISSFIPKQITHSPYHNVTNEGMEYLKVATYLKQPFIYQDETNQHYKGIEFEILRIIAAKENLKLSFKILNEPEYVDERILK